MIDFSHELPRSSWFLKWWTKCKNAVVVFLKRNIVVLNARKLFATYVVRQSSTKMLMGGFVESKWHIAIHATGKVIFFQNESRSFQALCPVTEKRKPKVTFHWPTGMLLLYKV